MSADGQEPRPARERLAPRSTWPRALARPSSLSGRGATPASMLARLLRAPLRRSKSSASAARAAGRALRTTCAHLCGIAQAACSAASVREPTRRALRIDDSTPAPPPPSQGTRYALFAQRRSRHHARSAARGRRGVGTRTPSRPADRREYARPVRQTSRYMKSSEESSPPCSASPLERSRESSAFGPELSSARGSRYGSRPLRHWRLLQWEEEERRRGAGPLRLDFFKRLPVHIHGDPESTPARVHAGLAVGRD